MYYYKYGIVFPYNDVLHFNLMLILQSLAETQLGFL